MKRGRLLVEWYLIALLALGTVAALVWSGATARLDNVLYDRLIGSYAAPPSDRILIVAIDDASVAALGRWPWPREVHARMLARLAAAHPRAVAYDVLFTEPAEPADDQALGQAIHAASPVGLPILLEAPGPAGEASAVTLPIAPLRAGGPGLAHVALATDADGTARAALLSLHAGGRSWLHLMEWTYRAAERHPSAGFVRSASDDSRVVIPYLPSGGEFRTVSFASVLAGEVPEMFVKDRIVLVGATAAGLGDRYRVPLRGGGTMPGIEIQANLLNGLLADRLVLAVGDKVWLWLSMLPSAVLLLALWWFAPGRVLVLSLGLLVMCIAVPSLLLTAWGIWFPPAPALAGLLLIYPLWGWRRLQEVDRAVGHELALFAQERTALPPTGPAERLDRIGGHVVQLRGLIQRTRDLRSVLDDAIDGVSDPLLVTDLDDHLLLANRPAMALLDLKAIEGSASKWLSRITKVTFRAEALPGEIEAHDGRVYSVRRSPMRDGTGARRGWVILLADISSIRRAERERDEALEFLSHDMRSPQSSIIALLDGVQDELPQAEFRRRIRGHARKTLALADNFVQLARMKATPFAPETLNISDVLIDAMDELWPQASQRGIRIVGEGLDQPRFACGERDALTRAFVNLLDNAVKFTPPGGTVECAVTASATGNMWQCTIDDEGPEIAGDLRSRLFTRFAKGASADAGVPSVGLGLAYVRATAERHGGGVACEARQTTGNRFILMVPAIS